MDFGRVIDQFDYWDQFPPTHLLLRGYVGYQPRPRRQKRELTVRERMELAEVPASPHLRPFSSLPLAVQNAIKRNLESAERSSHA